MRAIDFEYDGLTLRNMGFMICKFGSNGVEITPNSSAITFNTISTMRGAKHEITSSEYSECITSTFQLCKYSCNQSEEVSVDEAREIMKWLNRKGYYKFKLIDVDYMDFFFEASFNVKKIEINGKIYGFELEMMTNRPFALREPITITIRNIQSNGTKLISSQSDEEGYIYPTMEISIDEDGDLEIYNDLEKRTMCISNCKAGEIIKVNYPIIETSLSSHKIQNDFNWIFFRIANSFREHRNELTISLPCTIKITYSPIVKIGI